MGPGRDRVSRTISQASGTQMGSQEGEVWGAPAVAVVAVGTVQKELFKNVAEILLEAQAAGRLGGVGRRRERRHPSNPQGGVGTSLVLGTGGSSRLLPAALVVYLLYCQRSGFPWVLGFGEGENWEVN